MAEGTSGYRTGIAKLYRLDGSSLNESEIHLLSCPKCKLILRYPRQVTTCGCRYCAPCIEQLTRGSCLFTCLVDDTQYEKNDVRKDRGCQRELESLEVDCPAQPQPCTWRGKLTAMEVHLAEECPKRLMLCSQGCGQQCRADELECHISTECVKRQVDCQYCNEKFPMVHLQDHYTTCQMAPGICDFCGQVAETKHQLSEHYNQCPNYSVPCPYHGCNFKSGKREMDEHLMTSHVFQLVLESTNTRDKVVALETENRALHSTVCQLTAQVEKLLQYNEHKDAEIRELKVHIGCLSSDITRQCVDSIEVDSVKDKPHNRDKGASREPGGLGCSTGPVDVQVKRVEETNSQVQRMSECVLKLQTTVTEYGTLLEEIRLRQDILDVKTTNGILIWKIPDVRRRYHEAVERKTLSLYSPPFYTSPHGYKVCIRAYLNGDGAGKGTHISLFFFIMRSEQDNLLSWPFKQSVRFTLIHQKKASLSTSEAFVPDPNSPSFKKPESDMNIASGFPKFARQAVLQDEGFTKDNAIFIKCQVDLSGLLSM